MNIKKIVNEVYPSIIKRIPSRILPLTLIMLYLTAYWSTNELALRYISYNGMKTLHFLSGFVLIMAMAALIYDSVLNPGAELKRKPVELSGSIYRLFVNVLFYLMLALIACSGAMLFIIRSLRWDPAFFSQTIILMFHVLSGGLFIAIIPIKYYLWISSWFKAFMEYLREE